MNPPDLLSVHQELLERWRHAMNLVGPGPIDPHYADCRRALASLAVPDGERWADLGTGAGFPGVVFAALFPRARVDLVDSRSKRCAFLREVVGQAERERQVDVVCDRIEALTPGYDGVMSRALAAPDEVLRHAAHLVRPGGRALLMVADVTPPVAETFTLVVHDRYAIDGKARAVLVYARTGDSAASG